MISFFLVCVESEGVNLGTIINIEINNFYYFLGNLTDESGMIVCVSICDYTCESVCDCVCVCERESLCL